MDFHRDVLVVAGDVPPEKVRDVLVEAAKVVTDELNELRRRAAKDEELRREVEEAARKHVSR